MSERSEPPSVSEAGPYRTISPRPAPRRWRVTRWQKWWVRTFVKRKLERNMWCGHLHKRSVDGWGCLMFEQLVELKARQLADKHLVPAPLPAEIARWTREYLKS